MGRQGWKKVQPRSLRHAMELCLQFARERHNRSVDRVADLMGLSNKWVLYKWLENGRLPAVLIRPFEVACGAEFLTRYVAQSAHKVLVDVPSGRRASPQEVNELQAAFAVAVGHLLRFYAGEAETDETIGALTTLIEGAAWHRENVGKARQPELGLFEED